MPSNIAWINLLSQGHLMLKHRCQTLYVIAWMLLPVRLAWSFESLVETASNTALTPVKNQAAWPWVPTTPAERDGKRMQQIAQLQGLFVNQPIQIQWEIVAHNHTKPWRFTAHLQASADFNPMTMTAQDVQAHANDDRHWLTLYSPSLHQVLANFSLEGTGLRSVVMTVNNQGRQAYQAADPSQAFAEFTLRVRVETIQQKALQNLGTTDEIEQRLATTAYTTLVTLQPKQQLIEAQTSTLNFGSDDLLRRVRTYTQPNLNYNADYYSNVSSADFDYSDSSSASDSNDWVIEADNGDSFDAASADFYAAYDDFYSDDTASSASLQTLPRSKRQLSADRLAAINTITKDTLPFIETCKQHFNFFLKGSQTELARLLAVDNLMQIEPHERRCYTAMKQVPVATLVMQQPKHLYFNLDGLKRTRALDGHNALAEGEINLVFDLDGDGLALAPQRHAELVYDLESALMPQFARTEHRLQIAYVVADAETYSLRVTKPTANSEQPYRLAKYHHTKTTPYRLSVQPRGHAINHHQAVDSTLWPTEPVYVPQPDQALTQTGVEPCQLNQVPRIQFVGNLMHLWLQDVAHEVLEGECLATQNAFLEAFAALGPQTHNSAWGYTGNPKQPSTHIRWRFERAP
jgi:hypothetical protein